MPMLKCWEASFDIYMILLMLFFLCLCWRAVVDPLTVNTLKLTSNIFHRKSFCRACWQITNRHPRRSLGSVKVKPKPVIAVAVLLTVCPTLTQWKVMRTCRTKGRRKVVVWLVGSAKGVGSGAQRRRRTRWCIYMRWSLAACFRWSRKQARSTPPFSPCRWRWTGRSTAGPATTKRWQSRRRRSRPSAALLSSSATLHDSNILFSSWFQYSLHDSNYLSSFHDSNHLSSLHPILSSLFSSWFQYSSSWFKLSLFFSWFQSSLFSSWFQSSPLSSLHDSNPLFISSLHDSNLISLLLYDSNSFPFMIPIISSLHDSNILFSSWFQYSLHDSNSLSSFHDSNHLSSLHDSNPLLSLLFMIPILSSWFQFSFPLWFQSSLLFMIPIFSSWFKFYLLWFQSSLLFMIPIFSSLHDSNMILFMIQILSLLFMIPIISLLFMIPILSSLHDSNPLFMIPILFPFMIPILSSLHDSNLLFVIPILSFHLTLTQPWSSCLCQVLAAFGVRPSSFLNTWPSFLSELTHSSMVILSRQHVIISKHMTAFRPVHIHANMHLLL